MKTSWSKPNCLMLLGGLFIGVFLAYIGLVSKPAGAVANNQTINFQGRLLNSQGATVPDGFYNIQFKVYQDGDGQSAGDTTGSPAGSLKWTENWLNSGSHGVKVVNGFMSVQLGSVTAFGSNIDWNQGTLWLSMNVGDTSNCTITTNFTANCNGDGEMLPMQPLTASPYSLNSGELNGLTSNNFVQLAQGVQTDASTNSSIYINKTGSSGSVLELQKGGVDVMNVSNTGTLLLKPSADSTTALQVQNHANGYSVFSVDTSGNAVVLGQASSLTGKLQFATAGGGTLTLSPTSSASSFTITFPGETGTVCTTAAAGVCNTAGGLSNVAYLNQTQTFTGTNTFAPTTNISSEVVKQTSASSPTADIFDVQGTNGTSNFIQVTSAAANQGAVTVQSFGVSNGLTLQSASGTISLGTSTALTSAGALSVASGGSSDLTLNSLSGTLKVGSNTSAVLFTNGGAASIDAASGQNLSVGTSASNHTTTLGSTNGTSTTTVQSGSGGIGLSGNTTVSGTNTFTVNGGLTTLQAGLTANGGAIQLNVNSNNNTSINTGSSTGTVSIGNSANGGAVSIQSAATVSIASTAFNLDTAGDVEQLGYLDSPYGGLGQYANLLLRSEQLDNAAWTASNITVTANDGASNPAPDGNTTADKLVSTASGTHSLTQTYSSAGNNTYTFSIWVKSNSSTQPFQLRIDSNGTPATGSAASFTATTTWQRFFVTQTFTSGVTTVTPTLLISTHNTTVVGWGAQLVQASVPEVYVRTVGSSVAAADGVINNGQAVFIPSVNSTTAYQFQNNAASDVLDIDTTNNRVGINLNNPGYALDVSGDINASGNLRTGGAIRLDNSGNLSNIGNITASGNINTTSGAFQLNGTSINTAGTLSNVAYLNQTQTFTGTNTFAPTTNIGSAVVKQTSAGSPTADIFDVQGTNGTSNFIQVTSTAANQGALNLQSFGSNDITLNSGSGTVKFGSGTSAVQFTNSGTATVDATSGQELDLGAAANAHTTKVGSTSGAATTTIQSGTGGINLNPNGGSNTGVVVKPVNDSTAGFQVQNAANSKSVMAVDTTNGQVVLGTGGASGVTGQIKFNYTGQTGSITLVAANPSSTAYTITLPAETGTICTTAASAACTAVYATTSGTVLLAPNNGTTATAQSDATNYNSIFINKTSGTGNILELQKSASDVFKVDNTGNVTSTGQNTLSRNGSGSNDYTLGVTGTPAASSSSSLVRLGNALTGGNGVANGGTYLSIIEPSSGAGSAADFLNLQNGSTVELQLSSTGNLTIGGTYNGNTFDNSGHLTFGNSGAATISSNGSAANNLTVDTGNSGATLVLGNTAGTTNIGTTNAAHTIGIGTGGGGTNTEAVTIGAATNSSSTLTLQGGSSGSSILLQTGNNGTTAGGIQIGNTAGAFSQTITIGNNANAANVVNIGTGTAQDNVTIGDTTNASSSVSLKAGSTGGISLGANTTLSANSNFTYASGSGGFDAHNASGTFQTSTGNNSLNGATTVTGTNTFTVNGGATTLNGAAAGSGTAAKINTNAISNLGLVIQGASSQAAALLQLQDSTGATELGVAANGDLDSIGYHNTPYAGIGNYGNLLVQSEQLGTTWSATNISVTQNDAGSNPSPDGNTTADKLAAAASGTATLTQTHSSAGNNTYTFSIWLKTNSGSDTAQLRIDSNGTPATGTAKTVAITTSWQRFSVSQTFTSGVTTVTPTLILNNNSVIVGWGGQLEQGASAGAYTRTGSSIVAASSGVVDNQAALFQNLNNSATAYQFLNASGANVATVDTSGGQVILGGGAVSGQLKFNYGGQAGSITLQVANPSSTGYTITLPAETGTICTTAAAGACSAAGSGYVQLAPTSVQADATNNNSIFINKTSGTGNILELQKSAGDVFKVDNSGNVTSTGQNTLSRNSSGANDYTFGVTGTPSATGSSSLVRIGSALSGGNGVANGGTYLSIVEPSSGAGSAADFFNLQNGSTVELQLTSGGNLTVGGTYNGNTFDNAGHLTFGNAGAATISSNGAAANNLTVDTGNSGATLALGNTASTTNIGTTNAAHTISIGTGGGGTNTEAVTIGAATNSSSTVTLQGGNGGSAISLLTGNNGAGTAGGIQIGNTSGGQSQTISIGTNNAASSTNVVNLGTGTSTDTVTIGDNTNAASSVSLKAGSTGGISLGANTTLSANSNLTYASGTGKFDASNASGTFDSTTGTNHLNGATTVTGTNTFTVNGGATVLNGATAGSGTAAKVNTNAASNAGLVIQGASSQTAKLLQLQDSTNANLLTVDPSGNQELLGYLNTPYGGYGPYSNLLLYSEQFDQSGTWAQSNITSVTANDNNSNPAPDGTTTADKITASGSGTHSLTQTYTTSTNGNYTFSVWLKSNSGTVAAQLRIDSTGATPTTGTAASFTATTTWQRFSVTQNFTGTPSNIKAVLLITNASDVLVAWGGQMQAGTTSGVYVRTLGTNTIAAADGLVDNGQAIFIDSTNSTTAYQFQNNAASDVLDIDTTNNRVGINLNNPSYALDVSGDINTSGNLRTGGTIRLSNAGALSNITTITASGAINTTAGAFQLNGNDINTNGTLSNVAYLSQTQTLSGTNTFSAATINLNDSTIASNQSTIAVFNSPTNVTEYQSATSISIGGTSGTLTVRNANLTFGNAAGSGTFTNNGASLYSTDALGDLAAGSIGTAASTVDVYTSFSVAPTASGRAYTIPTPTASTTYGRTIYISNIGATGNYFTIGGIHIPPGSTAALMWSNTNGGDSWQFAGAGGASIENQNTNDQPADFRISGTGRANTSFTSPLFDSITGGLSVGTGTATGVTVGGTTNTTSVLLQGAASATYTLGTSNNTGGITVGNSTDTNTVSIANAQTATGKTQTVNIGTSATGTGKAVITVGNTNGASSVTLQAGTGGITLTGATTISGSNTFATGTGSVSLNGDTTVANGKELILGGNGSDLTCTNGAIFYRSDTNRFRGCENGTWIYIDNYSDVKTYTSGDNTWNMPTNAATIEAVLIGGGGGGGGGGARNGGQERNGGGGGGGGDYASQIFAASDLAATAHASVGGAGSSGAGAASSATAGSNGGAGGNSCFSSAANCTGTIYLEAYGGGGGGGGNQAGTAGGGGGGGAGAGAAGSTGSNTSNTGASGGGPAGGAANTSTSGGAGAGGGSSASGTASAGNAGGAAEYGGGGGGGAGGGNSASGNGGSAVHGAGGGGAGGSTNSGNSTGNSGAGGVSASITSGGGGTAGSGACPGGVGGNGSAGSSIKAGSGGGGGGANGGGGAAGCNGGNGGAPGGGGGGGGSGSTSAGNGGTGGAGEIWIISW